MLRRRGNTLARSDCALHGTTWRAQYYDSSDVALEDLLIFNDAVGTFEQVLTAYPYQPCDVNSVTWIGAFANNGTDVLLTYQRCTPASAGCLKCTPTTQVWAAYEFSNECQVLLIQRSDQAQCQTYIAGAQGDPASRLAERRKRRFSM